MEGFLNKEGQVIILKLIETVQKNREYLSEVDGLIGDGDHGINMNKGFTLCGQRMAGQELNFSDSLKTLGRVLLTEIGGSMGPLYGTFFNKMARRCKNEEEISALVFGDMLKDALNGIAELGNAKLGDKTLMDVLIPASDAFDQALKNGGSFSEALRHMKQAAEAGMNSTKDMVARIGRASRLGERSRGVLDAGAVSCNLLLQAMADTMLELIRNSTFQENSFVG
ncbi:MAG TPA: dihydroxyacetone kinase subunit L [Ruminiclostridium sp.]|jgi:dihydroxyacetone kinase-like protein|nr:dihydroxyacetone kinase subunit L [Ruminiclostridium sp.]